MRDGCRGRVSTPLSRPRLTRNDEEAGVAACRNDSAAEREYKPALPQMGPFLSLIFHYSHKPLHIISSSIHLNLNPTKYLEQQPQHHNHEDLRRCLRWSYGLCPGRQGTSPISPQFPQQLTSPRPRTLVTTSRTASTTLVTT